MQNIKVQVSLVTSLSDQELEDVTSISDQAYRNAISPAANLLVGGKLELFPDLFRSMTRACIIDGECYIATEVATQKIVGTALWFPPGKSLWATEDVRKESGFNTFYDQLDQATKDWWVNEYDPQVTKFLREYYGPETATGSWWLNNIAVLPEYQGRGIGTSLCGVALNKAAANEAVGCCTDSESNVKFYTNSVHFKEVGVFYMLHPVNGENIKIWALKRYGARALA